MCISSNSSSHQRTQASNCIDSIPFKKVPANASIPVAFGPTANTFPIPETAKTIPSARRTNVNPNGSLTRLIQFLKVTNILYFWCTTKFPLLS